MLDVRTDTCRDAPGAVMGLCINLRLTASPRARRSGGCSPVSVVVWPAVVISSFTGQLKGHQVVLSVPTLEHGRRIYSALNGATMQRLPLVVTDLRAQFLAQKLYSAYSRWGPGALQCCIDGYKGWACGVVSCRETAQGHESRPYLGCYVRVQQCKGRADLVSL